MFRTLCSTLAAVALLAGPLAAQDTTGTKKDTTGARPVQDTTAARKDTIAVLRPDTTAFRKDTAAVFQPVPIPAPDTTRKDTAAVQQPAPEQVPDNAVKPGMTAEEVRARWGDPVATRTVNDWTYIYYRNHDERAVGYYDVVMLQHGQVMDAIVRSPDHPYAGVSSSPEGRAPEYTPPQRTAADSSQGAAVTGVRVKPSP